VTAWEMQQSQRIIPLPGLSGDCLAGSVGANDIDTMPSAVQTSICTGVEARANACETKGANALNRIAKQAIQAQALQCRVTLYMQEIIGGVRFVIAGPIVQVLAQQCRQALSFWPSAPEQCTCPKEQMGHDFPIYA
jgi:hypothetical protein